MNALKTTLTRSTVLQVRRMATTTVPKTPLELAPQLNFRKIWLSDTATYPLIVIMGGAITFMTGMGINGMVNYKDVRVDKKKRGTLMRDWGHEEKVGVVHTLVRSRYEKIKSDRAERRTPASHHSAE